MSRSTSARRDGMIILAAVIGVVGYRLAAQGLGVDGFPLDDAWIHQTYARNLAASGQWAFVPGQPSAGSTSPLYTLLLAAGYALGLPFRWWTAALGVAALAGAGLITARMSARLLPDQRAIPLLSGLAVVLTWHLIWAAASGMETMLFAALTLGMVALAWREGDARDSSTGAALGRGAALGALGAAAMLTRPEGAGLLALIGMAMWIVRPQGNWRGVLWWSVGVGLGWLAGFVPYALFNLSLGGSIFPGTASAKQAEYAILLGRPILQRIADLLVPVLAGGQFALVPGMIWAGVALASKLRSDRAALLYLIPLIWGLVLVGLYAVRLPAAYQHGRYVMPALPHLILMGVMGTVLIARRGRRQGLAGRVIGRALALVAVILFGVFWLIGAQQYARDVRIIDSEMVASARWIAENLPPEELLAVHDIGAVGYFAPRPILDLAGLVSPEVIPILRNEAALWALLEAREVRYLLAFPDQVPGGNPADPRLQQVFVTDSPWAAEAGGANMVVYALAWGAGGS